MAWISKLVVGLLLLPHFTVGQSLLPDTLVSADYLELSEPSGIIPQTEAELLLEKLGQTIIFADSIPERKLFIESSIANNVLHKSIFNFRNGPMPKFTVPLTLISLGFAGLGTAPLLRYNHEVHEEVVEHFYGFHTKVDNYTRHIPIAAAYGLNLAGIKGKHDLVNLTILFALSDLLTNSVTDKLKNISHEIRPDLSAADGFPSGHTSSAFAKATILYLEYKDRSVWYGVGGYAFATATGALRMLNNRHWLTDVLAGAGVGILSTQAVYAVYPWLKRRISHVAPRLANKQLVLTPAYAGGRVGFGMNYLLTKPNQIKSKSSHFD